MIHKLEGNINQTLENFLKPDCGQVSQDRLVIEKDGRQTLPVKTEFQSKFNGTIVNVLAGNHGFYRTYLCGEKQR